MESTNLNNKIQALALQKAKAHVEEAVEKLKAAEVLFAHGNKKGGAGTYWGKDVVGGLFIAYGEYIKKDPNYFERPSPPKAMIDYYAGQILDEILKKLPLIKELNSLSEEMQ